jgi:hypothetical protein
MQAFTVQVVRPIATFSAAGSNVAFDAAIVSNRFVGLFVYTAIEWW